MANLPNRAINLAEIQA